MAITTDRDKLRLEIGDTDVNAAMLSDEEMDYFLTTYGSVLDAAVAACEALARGFARQYDFAEDGSSFSRSQQSKAFAQHALTLRRRVAGGISTSPTTRVDGYSETIDFDDVDGTSGVGRIRIGYTDPDLPM